MQRYFILLFITLLIGLSSAVTFAEDVLNKSFDIYSKKNLVAWCIVSYDGKKRGPEERATMLKALGIRKLAYDYRAEHVPTFDAEMRALKKHGIELTAWRFPQHLNDSGKHILSVLKQHKIKTELWVSGSGQPKSPDQ